MTSILNPFNMTILSTTVAIIAAYFIFDFVRGIVATKNIFKQMMKEDVPFMIEKEDCLTLSDRIAFYIATNF